MLSRRRFLQTGSAALMMLTGKPLRTPVAYAGDSDVRDKLPDGSAAKDMITPACQQAIDAGLAFLAQNQHADGSFGTGGYQGNVAITSLGALAMMSSGHQPGRGKYGKVVQDALEFVLHQEKPNIHPGYLYHDQFGRQGGHGPMYGHGFGTLFLAEVYGMVHNKELRERLHDTLKRAVDLIINTQNRQGGWRYLPEKKDADISVTICQIMALRAARNAGFYVPKETADKCVEYVKSCQNLVKNLTHAEDRGSFNYMAQVRGPNPIAFARTAAGVVALYSAGVYKGEAVEEGLKYLLRWKRGQENGVRAYNMPFRGPDIHYFYGHYYAVQAMWTAGGAYWTEWFPFVREELLTHSQRRAADGSWHDNICSHYATAMACIVLQVPNNYLPILQK
jgi:hypothetical protein